jgi:putative ABC transport system substrate-binding protein
MKRTSLPLQRREFIAGLGGAAMWPLAAGAQPTGLPVIGYLQVGSPDANQQLLAAVRKGLDEVGYSEGRNVIIEYRWANNDTTRLPDLAADLVRRKVAVIAAVGGLRAGLAAKDATTSIPIVFTMGGFDPVDYGLVTSLNRPTANVTGITSMNTGLSAKRLGLLHELLPKANRFGALVNRTQPGLQAISAEVLAAGAALGWQIEIFAPGTSAEIDAAFEEIVRKGVEAILVSSNSLFRDRQSQLITRAARHAIPTIYPDRESAVAGGLMSYGSSITEQYRQVGIYVGRLLKGERPSDLPVMRAAKLEFVINLQTARLLGLAPPPTLLAIADEVIE